MSSPAGLRCSQADFLARWMPGSTGPDLAGEGSPSPGGPDDSFASDFAPLPGSSLDSRYLGVDRSPVGQEAGREAPESGQSSDGELEDLEGLPIRAKLEQLRKWQQHMQEQLKAHQLEELLRLQDKQQRLLGMMNGSQHGTADDSEASGRCDSRDSPPGSPISHHGVPRRERLPGVQDCEEEEEEEGRWNSRGGDPEQSADISHFHEHDDAPMPRNGGGALSEEDGGGEEVVFCERPIQPGGVGGRKKTFEELLEEQLRLEEQRLKSARQQQSHGDVQAVHAAPKRAFLKRGEGLLRFTTNRKASLPKTGAKKKDLRARAVCRSNSEPAAIQSAGTSGGSVQRVAIQRVAVQRKTATLNKENRPQGLGSPPQDVRKAARAKVLGRNQRQNTEAPESIQSELEEARRPRKLKEQNGRNAERLGPTRSGGLDRAQQPGGGGGGVPRDSFESSFQEKLQRWDCDRQLENVELGEFELLEQAAEELSFSSNSSFVMKVLQMDQQHRGLDPRRLSSTPIKSPPGGGAGSAGNSGSDVFAAKMRGEDAVEDGREDSDGSSGGGEFEEREVTAFCFPAASNPPYDKRSYQDEESGGDEAAADETRVDDVPTDESTLNEDAVVFDDDDTWNEPDDDDAAAAPRILTRKVALSRAVEEEKDEHPPLPPPPPPLPPASQLMTRLFPSLKPKAQNAPLHPPVAPESTKSEETTGQQLQSRQLRERLVELEIEIERFKKENAALCRLRQENEKNRELLGKERSAFEQLRAQQLAEWEELKKEEGRKLQKERRLFEKHAAAARAGPDKKEREEIQVLKQQLCSLQEELRGRESRWAAAHSRLRQQVDALGQDNSALRDQIRMLEKLRLSTWKKPAVDAEKDKEAKDPRTSEGSTTVTKGVKFASPLDSRGGSSISPPQSSSAAATRRSSHGAAALMKSSLRRPSVPCLPSSSSSSSLPGRRAGERWTPAGRNQGLDGSPRNEPNEPEGSEEREPESAEEVRPSAEEVRPSAEEVRPSAEEVRPSAEEVRPSAEEACPPPDGKVETLLAGGDRLVVFTNGTKKEVSADGRVKVTFFNGDTKEVTADQRVIYFYANTQTTHVTFPDGVEVLHFTNNQTEKHFPDGRKEIVFPDQTVKNLFPGGREESVLTDGTVIQVSPDGTKQILFNTGQKEVHTAGFKRREYPDGTTKTVYADGRQETRYPNGRLRVKDRHGNVVLDSGA